MNPLLLILLLSLGQVGGLPMKVAAPSKAVMVDKANDPLIAKMNEVIDVFHDELADKLATTRNPESSTAIQDLKRQILHIEGAMEERRAALHPHVFPLPPAPVSEPHLMFL